MAVIRKVISILRLWGCGEVRHDGRAKGYRQIPEEVPHAVVQSHSCLHFLFLLLSISQSCGSRSRPQIPDPTFNTFLIPQYRVHKFPAAQFLIPNS